MIGASSAALVAHGQSEKRARDDKGSSPYGYSRATAAHGDEPDYPRTQGDQRRCDSPENTSDEKPGRPDRETDTCRTVRHHESAHPREKIRLEGTGPLSPQETGVK